MRPVRLVPQGHALALVTRAAGAANNRLLIPSHATLRPNVNSAFSVRAKVYGNPYFFSTRSNSAHAAGFSARADHFYIRGDSSVFLRGNIASGPRHCWRDVLLTYDGSGSASGMSCYINGISQIVTDASSGGTMNTDAGTGDLHIGASYTSASNLATTAGLVTDVMFFAYELTAGDARELFLHEDPGDATLSGADPFGWWTLNNTGVDAGSGGNDVSSAANFAGDPYREFDTRARIAA